MKIMHCPLNGPRNIQEFLCGGEVKPTPGGEDSDTAWADYVFLEDNPRGHVREWWCHLPSSYWFIVERDTATEEIIKTYPASELSIPKDSPGGSQ
jgi:sarcosine oxidase, subunit delta